MTSNVQNWIYKSKAEIERLDNKTLLEVYDELSEAVRMFHQQRIELPDEVAWQLMIVPGIVSKRGLIENPTK